MKVYRTAEIALNSLLLISSIGLILKLSLGSAYHQSVRVADAFEGQFLKVPGIDWNTSHKTLVLALNTHCHFCTASSPFYNRLLELAKDRGTRTVAIFPESIVESREYLTKNNLKADMVVSVPLYSINITGTPTLLIVGPSGKVIKSWKGQLPKTAENEVCTQM